MMKILKIEFPTIEDAENAVLALDDCKLVRFDSAVVILKTMHNANLIINTMVDNDGHTVEPTSDDEYTLLQSK